MHTILELSLSNTIIAALLALVAFGVSKARKNPHLARALWLIVLAKLLLPPLATFDWPLAMVTNSSPTTSNSSSESAAIAFDESDETDETGTARIAAASRLATVSASAPIASAWSWPQLAPILLAVWVLGSIAVIVVGIWRAARVHRLLASALPASCSINHLVSELSTQVGLRRTPRVKLVQADCAPFVWPVGIRCTVVLPLSLINALGRDSLTDVVLHELAHVRRKDHWIRWLELAVTAAHWWNPVMWLARRELHKFEEASCDAWVAAEFPARRKSYAHSLWAAAELLLPCSQPSRLVVAAFSGKSLLRRRIEMLLNRSPRKRLSARSMIAVALFALLTCPCSPSWVAAESSDANKSPADRKTQEDADLLPALLSAKQTRFGIAVLSNDGKAVRVIKNLDRTNQEVSADYAWNKIEVFNAAGKRMEEKDAKAALEKRRMVVLISGTRPIEEYALLWKVLAADTPVIRLMSPGAKPRDPSAQPAKQLSIENVGGGIQDRN